MSVVRKVSNARVQQTKHKVIKSRTLVNHVSMTHVKPGGDDKVSEGMSWWDIPSNEKEVLKVLHICTHKHPPMSYTI
jgi:hypothetical protein